MENSGSFSVDVLRDALKCPVCFETCVPPIYQCKNGHLTCNNCFSKGVSQCGSCRSPLKDGNDRIRCLILERLAEQLQVPCTFHGCSETVKLMDLTIHRLDCNFAIEQYCSKVPHPIAHCPQAVAKSNLCQHILEKHGGSLIDNFQIVEQYAGSISEICLPLCLSFDNQLFIIQTKFGFSSGMVSGIRWAVTLIGSYKRAARYLAEIVLLHNDSQVVNKEFTLTWRGPVLSLSNNVPAEKKGTFAISPPLSEEYVKIPYLGATQWRVSFGVISVGTAAQSDQGGDHMPVVKQFANM